MKYQNLSISDVDLDLGDGAANGVFVISPTDELIDATNKIRKGKGYTDMASKDNSGVYYTFYLYFNADKKEIKLQAECNYGEKDDEAQYDLPISAEEKESLMFLVIKYFIDKEWDR